MHDFLANGAVSVSDISAIMDLTSSGSLSWLPLSDVAALYAEPASLEAPHNLRLLQAEVGRNLSGIRLGFEPGSGQWHYLRLTDEGSGSHYVEPWDAADVVAATNCLYDLARKAIRLGGKLTSAGEKLHYCQTCRAETHHVALLDAPYGIAGAVMAGSERLTCRACETSRSLEIAKPSRA